MNNMRDIKSWKGYIPPDLDDPYNGLTKRHTKLSVDAIKVYCLLKKFISPKTPNGPHTLFWATNPKPMDRFIWWDFGLCNLESNVRIWLWRTNTRIEAAHNFKTDEELESFLKNNIELYSDEIKEEYEKLTKHETYINHYHSYGIILNSLWDKYNTVVVKYPPVLNTHEVESDEVTKELEKRMEEFTNAIIDKHVLGKSIVLFSSFYIESLISTLFRIGSVGVARDDKDVHSQIVKMGFKEKLQTITYYTPLFKEKFDLSSIVFKEVFALMTTRNKYTHTDKTAEINRVGEVYFDDDFPVFAIDDEKTFMVKNIEDTYALPNDLSVRNAYELTKKFDSLVRSNFKEEYEWGLGETLKTNPIGFNTKLKIFSTVSSPEAKQFFIVVKNKNDTKEKKIKK